MQQDERIDVIARAWSWAMPEPRQILHANKFGNVLVVAADGFAWRICPEELTCEQLCPASAVETLFGDAGFAQDWATEALVAVAEEQHGVQPEGRCFCLKIPSVLGGEYAAHNIGTNSVLELLSFAGELGRQIKDLPDGTKVELDIQF